MSAHYYSLCNRYRGRAVEIKTRDGRTHRGIIQHVDSRKVYIRPLGYRRGYDGFGYGYFGPRRRSRGFAVGIALGSIITLALIPFFFF